MAACVVVIEDNEANLELMVYLLRAFGHTVHAERDGASGLEALRRERPALVICDIQMPKMDGIEVARRVRADRAFDGIVLLAVSALAMVGDRESIMEAGFDGYFGKPIAAESFVQEVEAFLPARLRSVAGPDPALCGGTYE